MSILIKDGVLITIFETEVTCPICTYTFDVSRRMEKAKYPVFKMKCPGCKSAIGIQEPIFGGTTKCFEWADAPPRGERLETRAPFKIYRG